MDCKVVFCVNLVSQIDLSASSFYKTHTAAKSDRSISPPENKKDGVLLSVLTYKSDSHFVSIYTTAASTD